MSTKMKASKGQVNGIAGGPLALAGGDDKGVLVETLAANRTIKVYESQFHHFDPNGGNYIVLMPKISTPHHKERRGLFALAKNAGTSGSLIYKDASNTTTIATLQAKESAILVSNGVAWKSTLIPAETLGGVAVSNTNQAALVDNTGGNTSAVVLAAVTNTAADDQSGTINNNFARVDKLLEALRAALITKGIVLGS